SIRRSALNERSPDCESVRRPTPRRYSLEVGKCISTASVRNGKPHGRLSRPTCCVRRWIVIGAWLIVSRDVTDLRGESMRKISAAALAAFGVIGLVFVVQAHVRNGSPPGT